ncbi:5'-nucleotidase C-terminal domain-containing protein [uncultured Tyzzerella sp.]|uniref:5'-nucleotidase C-terminal domain-containing protein n=1 Tax=uncultured Tyzzerella sp. TaxID=2321398 RepID=UPI0029428866|nr:5'-nucleotidase C-terminal domain-containing protein [uncultured Tyzzerella sp.]
MKKFVNKKSIKGLSLALSLALAMSYSPLVNVFGAEQDSIIIYHTNDMHGTVKNLANVKTLRDNTKNSLLLDAGDCTQGSSLATYTQGEAIVDIMNATGYDAIVMGNHEFDFGSKKAVENMKKAKFTPLAANVVDATGNLILNGINGNGANVIEEINGKRIGIFGLTTEETYYKTNPKNLNGTQFKDVIAVAKKQVELLKAEKVDAIVAITHIGDDKSSSPTSLDLAKQVDGIDLIIDGHSHTIIQEKVNDTTIVQTGSALKKLGKVTLNFNNKDVDIKTELLDMETVVKENPANEEVSKVYNTYDANISKKLQKVIGNTKTDLYAFDKEGTRLCRIEETPMGDLIADAMANSTKKLLENTEYKNLPIVALQNGGGVRANIDAGDITLEDVLNVLPFGNLISVKVVTPSILYNALENGVCKMEIDANGKITGLDGRFPQISGMRLEIDPTKPAFDPENPTAGTGERITAIYLVSEDGKEVLLDRNDNKMEIALASNDFVIAGGDGYTALSNLKHIAEGEVLDVVLAEYITDLTEKNGGSFTYTMPGNRTKVVVGNNDKENKKQFKPIDLDKFLYLKDDSEVTLYNDVPEIEPPYWANESIYYFKALGIFEDSDNFYPNNPVTYGQFKGILQKLLGLENSNLEEYGITNNSIDKKYNDNDILTREDVALMIGNIVKAYDIEIERKPITINDTISDFAKPNFEFLAEIGILKGDGKSFNPQKNVTKAEISVILDNLTKKIL